MADIDEVGPQKDASVFFDRIGCVYDRTNRILSYGQDIRWRESISCWLPPGTLRILDVGCGTADTALALLRARPEDLQVIATDLSASMPGIGRLKADRAGYAQKISFIRSDARALPFYRQTFDVVTIAFALRNIPDFVRALIEARRVLKTKGQLIILELLLPEKSSIFYFLVRFYIRFFVPFAGGLFTGQPQAYRHLAETIQRFSDPGRFELILQQTGFRVSDRKSFMFGAARVWLAQKDGNS